MATYQSQYTGQQNDAAVAFGHNPDSTPTQNSTKGVTSGGVYAETSALKSHLTYGLTTFDILELFGDHTTKTNNGITFTNQGNTYIANGTATDLAVKRIWEKENGFPKGLVAGGTAYAHCITENESLRVCVLPYKNGSINGGGIYISKDRAIQIPSDSDSVEIRVQVEDGTTLSNTQITVALYPSIADSMAYYEFSKQGGILADNTDLNECVENAAWLLTPASRTYTNMPLTQNERGVLDVVTPYDATTIQTIVAFKDDARMSRILKRVRKSENWGQWTDISDISHIEIKYSDLDVGKMINLGLVAVFYNLNGRKTTNANFASKCIEVKAGDVVYLRTKAGSGNGKPYALISEDRIIYSIYTDSAAFNGYITIQKDGFLAVNVLVEYSDNFSCFIYRTDMQDVARKAMFRPVAPNSALYDFSNYDQSNPCHTLIKGASMASAIRHWGLIGASYDSGVLNFHNQDETQAGLNWYEYSWAQMFKRMNGIEDLYNYSNGGQHTKDWITKTSTDTRGYAYGDSLHWNSYYDDNPNSPNTGGWGPGGGCWWKMKADYENGIVKQAFIVVLGSNDIGIRHPHDANWNTLQDYDPTLYYEAGTIDDIGTYDLATDTDTPPAGKTAGDVPGIVNSYAAYMGAILNRILAIQPRALIFLATIRNNYGQNERSFAIWNGYNDVIRQIAEMNQFKDHVILVDYGKYGPNYYAPTYHSMVFGHPNAMGYQLAAFYYNTLIDYGIMTNLDKVKDSAFIGTDWYY